MKNEKVEEPINKKPPVTEDEKEELQLTKECWLKSIESEREYFINKLYHRSSEKVMNIIDKVINDLSDMDLEQVMVDHFLKQLRQQDPRDLQNALRSALEYGNGPLKIVTSYPLSEAHRRDIEHHIREVFAIDLRCQFSTRKSLGIGIELRTPAWKMGWNVKNYLNDLRQHFDKSFDQLVKELKVEGN